MLINVEMNVDIKLICVVTCHFQTIILVFLLPLMVEQMDTPVGEGICLRIQDEEGLDPRL